MLFFLFAVNSQEQHQEMLRTALAGLGGSPSTRQFANELRDFLVSSNYGEAFMAPMVPGPSLNDDSFMLAYDLRLRQVTGGIQQLQVQPPPPYSEQPSRAASRPAQARQSAGSAPRPAQRESAITPSCPPQRVPGRGTGRLPPSGTNRAQRRAEMLR